MWEDFHNKLVDSTLLNLDAYLQSFPDLKVLSGFVGEVFEVLLSKMDFVASQGRVAKRSRKLIDYDSARHHVETLQMSGMKNDRKMMKVSVRL